MKYRVRWDYWARDEIGDALGPWQRGQVIELDEALARRIQTDSGGVLHPLENDDQPRLMDNPPVDRMLRKGSNR